MLIRKNRSNKGCTPRLIVTSEFIEREKFKLLSQEEILKYFKEVYEDDDGFRLSLDVILDYLIIKPNFISI